MTSPPERADPARSDEVDDVGEDAREAEIPEGRTTEEVAAPSGPAASSGSENTSPLSPPAEMGLAEKPVLEWTTQDWATWMETAPGTVQHRSEPKPVEVDVAEVEVAEPQVEVEAAEAEAAQPQVEVEPQLEVEVEGQVEVEPEPEAQPHAVVRTEPPPPPDPVTELPEEEPGDGAFAELPEEWSDAEPQELAFAEPPEERDLEPEPDPGWWAVASTKAATEVPAETLVTSSSPPPAPTVTTPGVQSPVPVPPRPDRSLGAGADVEIPRVTAVTAPLPPARPPRISVKADEERSHRVRSVLGLLAIAVTVGVLLAGLVTVVTVVVSVALRRAVG